LRNQITILSHGFNKSFEDMSYLSDGLSHHGVNNIIVNLPITFKSLNDCLNSLHVQIYDIVKKNNINFIGHSMGGLIIRSYINKWKLENVNRCIFIATPHLGSKLAKISGCIPFYEDIFKPIKDLKPSVENKYLLINKNIEIGLIVGSKNSTFLGNIFLSAESDGRVEIKSALSSDAKDAIILPYGHKEIHHKEETLNQVKSFLINGMFHENNRKHNFA